jgi:pyruvate/2-oxoglutarate dehydrogenase complex dihydrolipoamide acyltransferase (E2) component
VQAYRKGGKQLVLFDDVDVGMTIEREIGGKRVPMGHVVRRANHKSFLDIHQEIRSVQSRPVPSSKGMASWTRSGLLLPWPLSRLFVALLRAAMWRDPTIKVSQAGTVAVTSVGMFGRGNSGGWGLTPPMHTLMLIVAGITRKPAVVEDRIEPREILNLTVAFDHDVIDGAPATRFMARLVELIESGYGLVDTEQIVCAFESVPV